MSEVTKLIVKNVIMLIYYTKEIFVELMPYSKDDIKRIREKLLLTQTEFAEKLGVSFETVNRWENGRHAPTMKARRKIKKLYEDSGWESGD